MTDRKRTRKIISKATGKEIKPAFSAKPGEIGNVYVAPKEPVVRSKSYLDTVFK